MRGLAAVSAAFLLFSSVATAQEPGPRAEDAEQPNSEAKPVPFDRKWIEPLFASGTARAAIERFRLDDWAGASALFARAVAAMPARSPDRGPARFLMAMALANRGQHADAAAIFEELFESYPRLAPYHAYNAARCRIRAGDLQAAQEWAAKVPSRSVPEAEGVLVKIDALGTLQKWTELEAETSAFLEKFPAGPRRAEAMFARAQALEKLGRAPAETVAVYRRIWREAPGEWGRRAAERIEALTATLPAPEATRLRTPTAGDLVTRGMELFERNQNADSEATFAAALTATGLDPGLACKAQFHRAQSVFKQRQRPRAAPLFQQAETACRIAKDADLLVKSLYQGARCLANAGEAAAALAAYAKVEADHPEHSYADDSRLRAAEIATDTGDEAQAAALLSALPDKYPKGDQAAEALWRLAWKAWRAGDYDKTLAWLDANLARYPREEIWYAEGRALYWRARVLEKQSHAALARAHYERAIREYPLSVYALLSFERMRRTMPAARTALLEELRRADLDPEGEGKGDGRGKDKKGAGPWQFAPRAVFGEPGFLRAVELARMGLGSDARRELARIGIPVPDNREAARRAAVELDGRDDVLWIAAVLLDRGRAWSASHTIPRYGLTGYRRQYPAGRGAAEWRIAYPRAFPEIVTSNSAANKVSPALQWAIMREESAFSPRIESFANALGLTQMLVETGQRFSPSKVTRETLLDPANNVELGSRFLRFLLDRYGNAAPLVAAGYNAGERRVDGWLKTFSDLQLDELMESIPFDETRGYTKRVMASYFTYSWLYVPGKPVPELSFALSAPRPERVGRAGRARARR